MHSRFQGLKQQAYIVYYNGKEPIIVVAMFQPCTYLAPAIAVLRVYLWRSCDRSLTAVGAEDRLHRDLDDIILEQNDIRR